MTTHFIQDVSLILFFVRLEISNKKRDYRLFYILIWCINTIMVWNVRELILC